MIQQKKLKELKIMTNASGMVQPLRNSNTRLLGIGHSFRARKMGKFDKVETCLVMFTYAGKILLGPLL